MPCGKESSPRIAIGRKTIDGCLPLPSLSPRDAAKVRLICIDIFVYNAARNYAGTTRVAKPAEQIPSALLPLAKDPSPERSVWRARSCFASECF